MGNHETFAVLPKYVCICMSPAIDATVVLESAPKGSDEIFKDVAETEQVGGKAINVARYLASRGAEVVCGGLLGEDNAALFEREFKKFGIVDQMNRVSGSTRRNEMIVWPGGSMKLNRAAFAALPQSEFAEAGGLEVVRSVSPGDTVVVSGSLPKNFASEFYGRLIAELKDLGAKTVLDASGIALKAGLEAHPQLIKPNAEECEAVVGFVPTTPEEFRRATECLREKSEHVIISDGGNGAWFDGEFYPAPKVEVVDTTAAGDTLLAEYCLSGDPRRAVVAGSVACTLPGGMVPPRSLIEQK